ncbi:hypothetical protein SAMN05216480_10591 [Pustulibacterium marinum]|uniref:Uncharacterized protein n=1 Tax=Pustulibacterium marinum TaxID=1224947 RepID=A0A1I7GN12_9FLAO|nr:hypothetical protein [Pustulibacterium marinum]SFU49656.1 hypothetical protein SAMN05216480_10591 [Pustulibacterium marinum]
MGLSEFEREVKQRLEERTINPSENAWEKLSSQLKDEQEKKKSAFPWYWVAAILVIACMALGGMFLQYEATSVNTTTVVDVEKEQSIQNSEVSPSIVNEESLKWEKQEPVIVDNSSTQKQPEIQKNPIVIESENKGLKLKNKFGKETENSSEMYLAVNDTEDEILENKKVDEVVQKLTEMQTSGTEITDATIDSLLLKAQKELRKERVEVLLKSESTTETLANMLLEEVEYDLDRSFKDKIFDALQNSIVKVKTAVATND